MSSAPSEHPQVRRAEAAEDPGRAPPSEGTRRPISRSWRACEQIWLPWDRCSTFKRKPTTSRPSWTQHGGAAAGHARESAPSGPLESRFVSRNRARALAEDLGWGDVTTESVLPAGLAATATLLAKSPTVLAGLDIAKEALARPAAR